jgi:DUF1365 family protein
MKSAIYTGEIRHERLRPARHLLRYQGFYLLLDLDELAELPSRLRLFSTHGFALFGFRDRDHGDGGATALRAQIERHLRAAGIEPDGGAIRLLCMPRVLGWVFNPLSVYFCHRSDGALSAVLYEVNNTFGQRHSYLLPITEPAAPLVRQRCAKQFYVSPFMDIAMTYHFKVMPPAERVTVAISTEDETGPVMTASFAGQRRPLSDANLWRAFLRHPLLALQVLGAIHWEALKLWRKGVALRPRPAPPPYPITIATAGEP